MKIDLIRAYIEVETLKALDLPLPDEKKKAIKKLERQFVNKDVIPYVTAILEPIFEGVQSKISLEIEYDPDNGLIVNKTDKKKKEAKDLPPKEPSPLVEEKNQEVSLKEQIEQDAKKTDDMFYIKSGVVDASFKCENDQYILLKGSKVKGGEGTFSPEKRREILHKCALYRGDYWEIISDYTFYSPSTLAAFCLGRSANGWIEAKNHKGKTLDEIARKKK